MRKLLSLLAFVTVSTCAFAQTDTTVAVKSGKKVYDLSNRQGDHIVLQLAQNFWTGAPDSISSNLSGFNRSVNAYVMLDRPFKSDPRLSFAFGAGVGTSNIYSKNLTAAIDANGTVLKFTPTASIDHYKKYKISTAYLEVPVEFRFSSDPENPSKSIKAALGAKVGTLLAAWTKGRNLLNSSGNAISNATYKVKDKDFFNKTRLAATARIGYGNFSLFGVYHFTPVFKDGVAADMKLLQIGLAISGL